MKIVKKALTWALATQIVIWGLVELFDFELLDSVVKPGFTIAKMTGDHLSLAAILTVNWFIFTGIWIGVFILACPFFPNLICEGVEAKTDHMKGYHEI